jgi:hypothetical protein
VRSAFERKRDDMHKPVDERCTGDGNALFGLLKPPAGFFPGPETFGIARMNQAPLLPVYD